MSVAGLRLQAKWGYRRLLRVAGSTFKDHVYVISQARNEIRSHYAANAKVSEVAALQDLVKGIEEVETMMRENIVQGRQDETTGRYQVKLTAPQQKSMKRHQELSPVTNDTEPPSSSSCCGCK